MKTFRNLKLICSTSEQKTLIDRIEQRLDNGWIRDRGGESEVNSGAVYKYFVFTCSKTASRPLAAVFFTNDENGYLYVAIVRSKLDGYDAVGAQVFVIGMGFNQSWV